MKPPQKIRQVSKHTHNVKKQNNKQMNEPTIAQHTYENMLQNAEKKQAQKRHSRQITSQ